MLDTFNFDLAQLDLSELVLLTLTFLNDQMQILLANLAITVLLVHPVLVLDLANLSIQIVYPPLLVILYLKKVLIDYVHRVRSHLLLFFLICFRELVYDLFVPIFELASVFDFGLKI